MPLIAFAMPSAFAQLEVGGSLLDNCAQIDRCARAATSRRHATKRAVPPGARAAVADRHREVLLDRRCGMEAHGYRAEPGARLHQHSATYQKGREHGDGIPHGRNRREGTRRTARRDRQTRRTGRSASARRGIAGFGASRRHDLGDSGRRARCSRSCRRASGINRRRSPGSATSSTRFLSRKSTKC